MMMMIIIIRIKWLPKTFFRFVVVAEITWWTSCEEKKREYLLTLYYWRAEHPSCSTLILLHPPTDSLSTKMHRKTQQRQDKVKSQSCIHSAPRLLSDKAQQGIWFMPFIFSSLHFLYHDTVNSVKFLEVIIVTHLLSIHTNTILLLYIINSSRYALLKNTHLEGMSALVKIPPSHPTKYQKYHLFKC